MRGLQIRLVKRLQELRRPANLAIRRFKMFVRPRRSNSETRVNQQKPFAFKRCKKTQRLNLLAAPGGECRPRLQKKWNVRPQLCGKAVEIGHRSPKEFVQREQRHRGIGAATPQARRERKILFQVNSNSVLYLCLPEK